ncbi:hypothetical protein ACFL14_01290 [Patescibacteria group bacterium]
MLSPREENGPPDVAIGEWPKPFVQEISEMGLKRVRLSIDYFDIENVDWSEGGTYSKYSISSKHDRTIAGLNENDIKIRYCLTFWDKESPGQEKREECDTEKEECYSRFKIQEEIQRYLEYTKFIVGHFKGKIQYYEILNEQQGGSDSQQFVEVDDYINLVKKVIPAIKQIDPKAKIVIGAIANLYEPGDHDYLLTLLNSDIMPLVDGISFHGLHGVSPNYELKEFYYNYPAFLKEIKDTASSNNFKGEYFGDELVWRTSINSLESEPWTYTETTAAKYYARGIVTQLGMDVTTGFTELEFDRLQSIKKVMGKVIHNLATIMAGAEPIELEIEIETEAEKIRSYSFSLTNRDKLIAIWTDGVAVDDDSGVSADLTFDGLSGKEVVAVDVLNGYQQSITTSNKNGNLVIENLIIRDYPLILKIKQ